VLSKTNSVNRSVLRIRHGGKLLPWEAAHGGTSMVSGRPVVCDTPETAFWEITPVKLETGYDPDKDGRNNGTRHTAVTRPLRNLSMGAPRARGAGPRSNETITLPNVKGIDPGTCTT
jgi:hypothetical protein